MMLSANFSLDEFKSKDGSETPLEVIPNLYALAASLEVIRGYISEPLYVNSGYRSPQHNQSVGGSPNSQHLRGLAADIRCDGLTPNELKEKIFELREYGLLSAGGLGLYDTFIHFDIRGSNAYWDYSTGTTFNNTINDEDKEDNKKGAKRFFITVSAVGVAALIAAFVANNN